MNMVEFRNLGHLFQITGVRFHMFMNSVSLQRKQKEIMENVDKDKLMRNPA